MNLITWHAWPWGTGNTSVHFIFDVGNAVNLVTLIASLNHSVIVLYSWIEFNIMSVYLHHGIGDTELLTKQNSPCRCWFNLCDVISQVPQSWVWNLLGVFSAVGFFSFDSVTITHRRHVSTQEFTKTYESCKLVYYFLTWMMTWMMTYMVISAAAQCVIVRDNDMRFINETILLCNQENHWPLHSWYNIFLNELPQWRRDI